MRNILEYLENTVQRFPDKPAFSDDNTTLTFREIHARAQAVGSFLLGKGYTKRPVAVYMGKRPETIAAFMGVVYSGCYYVPIDDTMPKDRIMLILNKLDPACIIAESAEESFAEYGFMGEIYSYEQAAAAQIAPERLADVRDRSIDTDPIYVVFTSGSTGMPKGVVACHRSVIDYVEQLTETLRVTEENVFGMQVPLYVDACLKEIFSTLKCGAHTWLLKKSLFMFPVNLVKYLNDHKINTLCWVVSALTMISGLGAFKKCAPEYLTTIAFGSEVFPIKQLKLWREHVPNARYINLYGPTEATGMSCWYELPADKVFEEGDHVPIGKPFKNTDIMLLDEDDNLAEEGEICIRGTCLTLGYYDDPERTAAVFCQNPLNKLYPELIYRTGDIARRDENGDCCTVKIPM